MPEAKNQHYVPKFYFRLFSLDGKNVMTFNLKREQGFRTPIDHLCTKPYYYSKTQEVESSIAQLESELARVLQAVAANNRIPEKGEDYILMICFLALQRSRTPVAKAKGEQLIQNLSDEIVRSVLGDDSDVKLIDPVVQLRQISNGLQFAPLLFDLIPVLLLNDTKTDFIFSDNPAVFHNNYFNSNTNFGNLGFQSPGLQILCPLNAKTALMLFDPEYYSVSAGNSERTLHVKSAADVELLNGLQIINCHENVFYSIEGQKADILTTYNKVRNLVGKSRVVMDKMYAKDGDKVREFLHTYETRPAFDLKLSFVANNPKADTSKLVRNREFCDLVIADVEKNFNKAGRSVQNEDGV